MSGSAADEEREVAVFLFSSLVVFSHLFCREGFLIASVLLLLTLSSPPAVLFKDSITDCRGSSGSPEPLSRSTGCREFHTHS